MLRWRRRAEPGTGGGADAAPTEVEVAVNFTGAPVERAVHDGAWLTGTHPGSTGTTLAPDEARVVVVW